MTTVLKMTPPLFLINTQESIKKKLNQSQLVTLVLQQHPLIKQGTEILKTIWSPKFTCKYLPSPDRRHQHRALMQQVDGLGSDSPFFKASLTT